ncbi:hypothetical protein [Escherichia coli]
MLESDENGIIPEQDRQRVHGGQSGFGTLGGGQAVAAGA